MTDELPPIIEDKRTHISEQEMLVLEMKNSLLEMEVFQQALNMVAVAIRMEPNDTSGACTWQDLVETAGRLIKNSSESAVKYTDHECMTLALACCPKVLSSGISRTNISNGEYRTGFVLRFRFHVCHYKDTTGLGDAIEHTSSYIASIENSNKTNYKTVISFGHDDGTAPQTEGNWQKGPNGDLPVLMMDMKERIEVATKAYIEERDRQPMVDQSSPELTGKVE